MASFFFRGRCFRVWRARSETGRETNYETGGMKQGMKPGMKPVMRRANFAALSL